MKKEIKLYNVIFPIWMLILIPPLWLVALPGNFIIDLLVLYISMKILKIENRKLNIKKAIWKSWIIGFAADFVGGFGMFLVALIDVDYETKFGKWWYDNLTNAVMYNPFSTLAGFLWATMCVVITSVIIYFVNKKWCLKKLEISDNEKKKIALAMAVFTAPFLFYLPTAWFY